MDVRQLLVALLAALLLAACAPEREPGAGSPSTHPSGHEAPASSAPADPYGY